MKQANTSVGTIVFDDDNALVKKEKSELIQRFARSWNRERGGLRGQWTVDKHQAHHRLLTEALIEERGRGLIPTDEAVSTVAISGDWHGNIDAAATRFLQARNAGADVLLHVGDLGIWPGLDGVRFLSALEFYAAETGVELHFVDGNHEEFPQLDGAARLHDETGEIGVLREGVYHLRRGSVWQWGEIAFAALGGAPSIDRLHRIPGRSWWEQERITLDDLSRLQRNVSALTEQTGRGVDVMVTHDAPMEAPLPRRAFPLPMPIQAEADDGRRMVTQAMHIADPKLIVHGHFHDPLHYPVARGVEGLCMNMESDCGAFGLLNLGGPEKGSDGAK